VKKVYYFSFAVRSTAALLSTTKKKKKMELNICGLDDDAPLPVPRPKKKTWAERQQQAPPARKERLKLLQVRGKKERKTKELNSFSTPPFFFPMASSRCLLPPPSSHAFLPLLSPIPIRIPTEPEGRQGAVQGSRRAIEARVCGGQGLRRRARAECRREEQQQERCRCRSGGCCKEGGSSSSVPRLDPEDPAAAFAPDFFV